MIAPWLLYTTFFGALLGVLGLVGERALRLRGEATRWLWLAAAVLTVLAPIPLNLIRRDPHAVSGVVIPAGAGGAITGRPGAINTLLLAIWLLASTLVALRVIGAAMALRRRRRAWILVELGSHHVLLTDELGPALIGWRRFTTVLPRWAFTFDESARALMLEHEAEHARAGDPHLRTAALVALILMPWNVALWWTTRRLRLAVEIDCDRRLLDRGVDPRRYASLLLAVGERVSTTPFAWATALGESPSSLEQRIVAMTSRHLPRHPRLATAAVSAAVLLIAAIACAAPVPDSVLPPPVNAVATDSHRVLVVACATGSACSPDQGGRFTHMMFRGKSAPECQADAACAAALATAERDSARAQAGATLSPQAFAAIVRDSSARAQAAARLNPHIPYTIPASRIDSLKLKFATKNPGPGNSPRP